jgi:CheY-like chemotaxis protein
MIGDVMSILLVEDNEIDIIAIQRAFKKHSIANPIYVARDGVEALEMLRGEGDNERVPWPYIVLLDLNMPRMNGFEFLNEIREDRDLKKSVVFVLTTSEDDRDKARAYEKFVAGYLSKNDAGGDFLNVIQLVHRFQIAVHFPPEAE